MPLDPTIPPAFAETVLLQFEITACRPMLGGLSGARVWQCRSGSHGVVCLRQWSPAHPSPERLQFIHDAIDAAHAQLAIIPKLHRDRIGKTFWSFNDSLWEVTQWMPGEANYLRQPKLDKLHSAIDSLARLHAVWYEFKHEAGPSPSIAQRIEMLSGWLGRYNLVEQIGQCVRGPVEGAACMSTVRMLHSLGPALLSELHTAADGFVDLQPVLRDVWSDHILFDGERVSGMIDFGAVRMDQPAADLARMLGSLHPFEAEVRAAAIERYNSQRPTRPVVASQVDLLDRSATLLTALQWMQWLVLERRKFAMDSAKLNERWQNALSRMMGESLLISG